jgi:hypothetical protein
VLDVRGGLGKPQLCVVDAAGQELFIHSGGCVVEGSQGCLELRLGPRVGGAGANEFADGHVFHLLLVDLIAGGQTFRWCWTNRKAADPGVGFRGLEAADERCVT